MTLAFDDSFEWEIARVWISRIIRDLCALSCIVMWKHEFGLNELLSAISDIKLSNNVISGIKIIINKN